MTTLDELMQDLVSEVAKQAGSDSSVMLAEYVVIATATGFDSDGDAVSQTIMFPSQSPEHRLLGLVEYGRLRLRAQILDHDPAGED